jgi:sugar phosphate isomerase/epimerase
MQLKYGISNWIYGDEPLEQTFIRLQKFGYDVIEIGIYNPDDIDVDLIKKYMDMYNIGCYSICTLAPYTEKKSTRKNLIDPDPEVRNQTIRFHKTCLDIGKALGAQLVLTVPSGVGNLDQSFTDDNKTLCAKGLREICEYAQTLGSIKFVIEPINRYENGFLHRVDEALILIEKVNHPSLKTMIDLFHANIEEDNTSAAIKLGKDNIINIHMADSNRKSLGRGQTQWHPIFQALKEIDYIGPLICEPLPPLGNVYDSRKGIRPEADLYAKECIDYLRNLNSLNEFK